MSSCGTQDELTAAVFTAVESMTPAKKAKFLLDHALTLIESGECVACPVGSVWR